jgi:predicted nucleic acid-binding protein
LSYLLDTNAISEPGRPRPDQGFVKWFDQIDEADVHLSVVTLGELRHGLALLPNGPRKRHLEQLHLAIMRRHETQILPVDLGVALTWGELAARHRRQGRRPSVSDELIAATALVHNLTVVTRNVSDFEPSGCRLISPWSG